jgi:predicted acyltransferase
MRLRSLDVFRGLTMAGMVIVNNPGDWSTVYPPLLHAEGHGWTPTDLIFPFFLFIVGAAMAQADPARHAPMAVLRRGATLVGVGLFMAGFPFFDVARWRVPGVLQRIGVCYVAAAFVWKGLAVPGRHRPTTARLLGATAGCLLGYWALLALVPAPGGAAGDLTAEGNLGAWVDRQLLGTHLWKTTWDPEGLLSSVPAVGTTLLGLTAGLWIRHERARAARQVLYSVFAPLASPRNASLLYAAANLVVLFVLLAWLHRRRWYWSV